MKTADGADFHLGMDLFLPVGGDIHDVRKIETSAETHFVDSFDFHGVEYHCLNRRDSRMGTDLRRFYSSQAAIIQQKIDELKREIQPTLDEIARLEILKGK